MVRERKLTISFGLVNIPIKLQPATKEQKVSFNQITPCCGTRVNLVPKCKSCKKEVLRAELKKGYEVSKDNYVVLTKEEIQAVRLPSVKTIVIEGFVPYEKLDPLLFAEGTFYVEPDEKGEIAYSALADGLEQTHTVAIGKVVSNGKENLVAIRRWGNILLLTPLWYPNEIRKPPEVPLREVSAREQELTKALIEACDGVDFKKCKDRYVEALRELITAKVEGREIKPPEFVQPQEVGIAEALEASLKQVKVKA